MYRIIPLVFVLFLPILVSAHVTVRPSEVGISSYQTFNVSVPTEKDIATVGVRLVIPEGLESVRPNVKPGWEIEIIKEGEGEAAEVNEIIWTGGSIPADQRDDFFFIARTPPTETTIEWHAYQTYSDGSVVSWDASADEQPKDASGQDDFSERGPYSETYVINDLDADEEEEEESQIVPVSTPEPAEPGFGTEGYLVLLALFMSLLLFSVS